MPKGLPSEACRADAKRNCTSSGNTKKSASVALLVGIVGTKHPTDTSAEKTDLAISCKKKISVPSKKRKSTKPLKSDHEARLKSSSVKKSTVNSVKTRSAVGVAVSSKDLSNVQSPSLSRSILAPLPPKMKDKVKVSPSLPKESIRSTLKDNWASRQAAETKYPSKKTKNDLLRSSTIVHTKSEPLAAVEATVLSKKDVKKRKEQPFVTPVSPTTVTFDGRDNVRKVALKSTKKAPEETAPITTKKESVKVCSLDEAVSFKKAARVMGEQCMVPKKRIKHKCIINSEEVDKQAIVDGNLFAHAECASLEAQVSSTKNAKFFKSKNKKVDKCKEVSSGLSPSVAESDRAFSVYDNLDEDSEESTCKKCPNKKTPPTFKVKMKTAASEALSKSKQPSDERKVDSKVIELKNSTKSTKKQVGRKEKRKLQSDSDQEADSKAKKPKPALISEDGDETNKGGTAALRNIVKNVSQGSKKSNKKLTSPKSHEDLGMASSSSDNAPLNKLVARKPSSSLSKVVKPSLQKQELPVHKRSNNSNSKKINLKKYKSVSLLEEEQSKKSSTVNNEKGRRTPVVLAPLASNKAKTPKPPIKKSVRFAKESPSKLVAAKPTPQRRQRMASLNALAMVHCMYENESKNVSVSSFDSTENSDDAGECATPLSVAVASRTATASTTTISLPKSNHSTSPKKLVSSHSESSIKQSLTNDDIKPNKPVPAVLVKFEPDLDQAPNPVICRESLRMAPGLRSVGKHWDMNGSSISSTLSDDNEMSTAVAITSASVAGLSSAPVIVKEYQELSSLEKPQPHSPKKKFSRASHRPVLEDSSEEEKHRVLLLEEKQRMMRRRRRQRSKEISMDLKDMVVCKRMASLNATAILAASYSCSSGTTSRRTVAVKSGTAATSSAVSGNGKSDEKRFDENAEQSLKESKTTNKNVSGKIKNGRGKVPVVRKKFSSSSDADIEDEADVSGSEVVVKTASSSGKQQVSLIVNQDSGVTITGLYLNSTTKSTHRQGYCSISGLQYRISSTSHTQTEATTVTTEAVVRTPQEPLRPSVS